MFHILASECSIIFPFFFLHPFFYNFFLLWLRKGQKIHSNRWKKGSMKCILDILTSLVAETRDTGSFSVSTLPLPTQVCQAPFPWLHFTAALNCNHFSYSRFPIWVSLYSCFYCILSNKGLSFLKEVCYAPFNSCMCV